MSRKKQTIEELLEEAIVSEEEQPYEVPENWAWVRLEKLTQKITDGAHKTPTYTDSGIPFISVKDIKNGKISFENTKFVSEETHLELSKRCNPEVGDILVTKSGTIGRLAVVNTAREFSLFVSVALIKPIRTVINSKFLELFLTLSINQIVGKKYIKGSSIQNLHLTEIKKIEIPLPSMQEQKRIAEKVEGLLNKIEEAKQLIEEAKRTFELRRAAILDKAFRGELTRRWREEKGITSRHEIEEYADSFYPLPSGWRWVQLSDVVQMQNGMSKRRGTSGSLVPVLRLADINGNEFIDSDLREIMLSEKEIEKYGLKQDEILFIRVNGSFSLVGKAIHFNLSQEAAYCDHLIRGTFDKKQLNVLYIKHLFESSLIRNQLKNKIVSSAGQNTVSQGSLGSLMIPVPPKEEMDVIVKIIENAISKEKKLLSYLDDIQIETIKQSILSKAFRGELGTNDPGQENSIELLKEILQEQTK